MTGREIVFLISLAVVGTSVYVYLRPPQPPESAAPGRSHGDGPGESGLTMALSPEDMFERLPGLYVEVEAAGAEGGAETGNLLFITADLELYKLVRSQVKYVREYVGSMDAEKLQLRADGSFSFYDYHGRKPPAGQDIGPQLQPLVRVNELAKGLLRALNQRNIELSVRLDRERPQFTEKQIRLLELLLQRPEELVAFMQDVGSETLWINDYLNERIYLSDGYLVIPAALTEEPEEIMRQFSDKSYEPDDMN